MIVTLKKNIRTINDIALPLIINMITSLLIGLVDQAMIGRISICAYAAVGVISLAIYSISGILGMISVSFNILGSKIKGLNADNDKELFDKFKITITLISYKCYYLLVSIKK